MRDPTYPLVPVANIFATTLLTATLMVNGLRGAHNRGIIMLEGWVLVQVVIMAIQSIIWRDSWQIMVPVFCDISSHLWQGLTIGIPACSFVITRRLWFAVQGNQSTESSGRHKMRRDVLVDYFLGIGVPLLSMALYYPVQGARFQVIENYGCSTYIFSSGVAILLFQGWLVVLPLLSVSLYGWRIVTYLYRHRRTTSRLLQQHGEEVGHTHYTRIFALACVDIILVLPLGIAIIVEGYSDGAQFWPGWDTVKEYWEPQTVTRTEWLESATFAFSIYWNQFSGVVLSVVVFLLFGMTRDARDSYRKTFRRTRNLTSSRPSSLSPEMGASSSTTPVKIRQTDSLSTVDVTKAHGQGTELAERNTPGPVVVDIEIGPVKGFESV